MRPLKFTIFFLVLVASRAFAQPENKVWTYPYLQNPTPTSVDIYWVDEDPRTTVLHVGERAYRSEAFRAEGLSYSLDEIHQVAALKMAAPRFLHRVALTDLTPSQAYEYSVELAGTEFRSQFTTMPGDRNDSFRFIAYADSETEPESRGKHTPWPTPSDKNRLYLVDEETGYRENLKAILSRKPQAVLIAGDLVESGGEQRDWDEFWTMNAQPDGSVSLAAQVPILPALGNHEYFAGPDNGKYTLPPVRATVRRYFTYFHPKGPGKNSHFYSQRLGPARIISLDSCDGTPHRTPADPNYLLDAAPRETPGIQKSSSQYEWLQNELASAQKEDAFTFVFFHHCPYSSGPHGVPPGTKPGQDTQSGQPLRAWTPLFMKYGVDALITGHDEMWERSQVEGTEVLPNGKTVPHSLQVYDVGVGGDGLRAAKVANPNRKFLAQTGSPERWENGVLVDGGRHYGHLEVNIEPSGSGWKATLDPVYIFPKKDGDNWSFERRLYPDSLILQSQ